MRIETELFPLIVVRWHGSVSEPELNRFFSTMDKLVNRAAEAGTPYAVVSDGEANFSPTQRKQVAAWAASFPERCTRWDRGNYVVVRSAAARGILTAVRWLSPRLSNIFVYASFDEALQAARSRLTSP